MGPFQHDTPLSSTYNRFMTRLVLFAASVALFFAAAEGADDYATSTVAPLLPPPQPGPPYLESGPMVGHVSASEAHIWIKATGAAKVAVRVGESADFADARNVEGPALEMESAFTGQVLISGLKPATRYFYSVMLDGVPALTRPWPSFVSAPADGAKGRMRFAFGSCVGKDPWLDAATWADIEARTPVDFVLLLGDNHYANSPDPAKQRAAFIAHRSNAGFRALTRRTPLYGIWDDHDFGPNDSDGTLPGKENVLKTFKEFFANPSYGEPDNPGVYFKLTRGDVDFFLLDGRYYRTPDKAPEDGTKTMLGPKQLTWLKREVIASKAVLKFICSGSEWQTQSGPDCWPSFARERREIFDHLAANGVNNVVLLSGDRHFTAAYQVEGRFIEVTSGPLGSPNSKVTKPAAEMFSYHDHGKIYSIFEVDTTNTPPALTLEIYEAGTGLLEKRRFTWEEVTGAVKIPPLRNIEPRTSDAKPRTSG